MATKKKKEVITSTGDVKEENKMEAPVENTPTVETADEKTPVSAVEPKKETKKATKKGKFDVGSIVYVSKEVEADLNGFNLSISQYKRDPYTVEAYDADTGVYTLRRSKLLIRLKEAGIVAPDANAHDTLNRMQY